MLSSMNLGGDVTASTVNIPDSIFAINALAVIDLHDRDTEKGTGRTLRDIVLANQHLAHTMGTLRMGYLLTFGRQSIPLLRKFLIIQHSYTKDRIDSEVQQIVDEMSKNL